MNFRDILNVADHNSATAKYETTRKGYSTSLPPPKKVPKSNVQSVAVQQFLARKQAEEQRRAEEARQKKAELLALRAQSSKNNKKAKIMASRTKDNDFSRIKLTEDEVLAKKKREDELRQLELNDKVARMKARIEMEEKEKLLPKKRKRKSKHNGEHEDESYNHDANDEEPYEEPQKPPSMVKKPAPPPLSFQELLKIAADKQFEPISLPVVKEEEERPLTKKAKRMLLEEENRMRRKMAAEAAANPSKYKVHEMIPTNVVPSKLKIPKLPSAKTDAPKSSSKDCNNSVKKDVKSEPGKQNNLKSNKSADFNAKNNVLKKGDSHIRSGQSANPTKHNQSPAVSKSSLSGSTAKPSGLTNFKSKPKENGLLKSEKPNSSSCSIKNKAPTEVKKKVPVEQKKKPKAAPSSSSIELSEEMLAEIEKRIRVRVQKELEEKLKQTAIANNQNSTPATSQNKPKVEPRTNTVQPPVSSKPVSSLNKAPSGKILNGQKIAPKGPVGQSKIGDPVKAGQMLPPKKIPPRQPAPFEKKPSFHPNPYLQPPRRLLETRRPIRPAKRRVESDDDEDDDESDMSDFIDDGPQLMDFQENYSEHIKEIFGYDKSKYIDDDDDDIVETSYSEQIKEENRSARIGYLEDLEDIRKEKEELARKKKKKKK